MPHPAHESSEQRIGVAFLLNLVFTIIEFVGGLLTNSTAILADAVHDLGDTLSLGLGWMLARLGSRGADDRFTYGYQRLSLLAALINGMVLVAGSIWILWEAVPRLWAPEMPHAQGMVGLAILGIAVNGYAAWRLSRGRTMNERILNWHLLEDVLGWVAVLVVSLILLVVDWPILDPMLSIAFTAFILVNVARHLVRTVKLFLQGVPDGQMAGEIRERLLNIPHVREVHHLHIWSLEGVQHVLTAHLVLDRPIDTATQAAVKEAVANRLEGYSLAHSTIELEQPEEVCRHPG